MSDDIVARLRQPIVVDVHPVSLHAKTMREAADEIERLRAELAAANEDGERLVELSQANVRRLETVKAERDALRADLDAYQKERDEEVVRLRADLAAEREKTAHAERYACERDYYRAEWSKALNERNALRALLREARWSVEHCRLLKLLARIDAALKGGGDE